MLKLEPDPTFKAKVEIGVPGGNPVKVEFTFKHRDRQELKQWMDSAVDKDDIDNVMSCVCGWQLTDEFSRENVSLLLKKYHSAARQIANKYFEELTQARLKN